MTTPFRRLPLALLVVVALAAPAVAQTCPVVPDDTFAFINAGSDECPADPEVFWLTPTVEFDCGSFADAPTLIDCGGDGNTCVGLCKNAASVWNADLPGRFTFVDADGAVDFCNTGDGKVSIGGTATLCDGTGYDRNVLAVTLSIFYASGEQRGQLIDANITVNRAFQFSQAGFQATLAHELGHVLGLSHPDQCGDDFNVLMRSASMFSPLSSCFVRDPTTADVRGAERIYPVVSPTPTPTVCGDADESGAVTVTDGVQVLRAAAALSSPCVPSRCDVDGSGGITVTDAVNVLRNAAGLSSIATCP